jgi:homoserine dehydrogenase
MKSVDVALVGVGHVGREFLRILDMKEDRLRDDYGLRFRVVLAADSSGVAVDPEGMDPTALRQMKEVGGRCNGLPGYLPNHTPADALEKVHFDLLVDSSPVNLQSGEPGLSATRAALRKGSHVVLANKGPLVLAYTELHDLAAQTGAGLSFSATVCGALPVINIGQRDLVAADISLIRGVFNCTTNFIIGEIEAGRSFDDALAEAQARGIAETDSSLDVDGWDAANKLVIVANSILHVPAKLSDVHVAGIRNLDARQLQDERARGHAVRLVAEARQHKEGYRLSVQPVALDQSDFLASCSGWEMGVEFHTDLYGPTYHKIWEREPLPTAAAMLRDAVNVLRES